MRSLRRIAWLVTPALLIGACASNSPATGSGALSGGAPAASTPATTPATAAASSAGAAPSTPTAPAHYFGNGKTYDAWVIKVDGSSLTIALVHHLTGKDAENYLISHGQTLPPDGVPDDYINVDTHVHRTVQLSGSAKISTNADGAGPTTLSASDFETWLTANPAMPIAAADQDTYPGAATYSGPLFTVTFTNDVMVSANQIFEP